MGRMNEIFVLDACALIALFENEEGAGVVETVLEKADDGNAVVVMNKVNLLEIYYRFYRGNGKEYAVNVLNTVRQSKIKISEFSDDILAEAGRLKASYKISLADSVALAQTIILKGSLLTADHHEFDVIEQSDENINFHWIRSKKK